MTVIKTKSNNKKTFPSLYKLVRMLQMEERRVPRIYQCVGTEDFLCPMNRVVKEKMEKLNLDYTYEEFPGAHDWDFWDAHIRDVLTWLKLKDDSVAACGPLEEKED